MKFKLFRAEDTPLIDRLRGEWLKLLGKKQQWDLFDAEYPRLINEDAELACYALQSRTRSEQRTACATPASCGSSARSSRKAETCPISTLGELYEIVQESDRVLTF